MRVNMLDFTCAFAPARPPFHVNRAGLPGVGGGCQDVGMAVTYFQPDGLVRSPAFSHVAVVPPGSATVYLGGQNGVDETGAIVSPEVGAQAARALDNARVALAAAGAGLDDVVQWFVLIDVGADLGAAYGAIAGQLARDGATPLVTASLVAGLGVPGALVEIGAIAALPG
jgi:enamine deaminase RidA (YjgF/YER057c/UK114 family)